MNEMRAAIVTPKLVSKEKICILVNSDVCVQNTVTKIELRWKIYIKIIRTLLVIV